MELKDWRKGEFVVEHEGRIIGRVYLHRLGRSRREFFDARALDGAELGACTSPAEALRAIVEDHEAGCPRSARDHHEVYRGVFLDGPEPWFADEPSPTRKPPPTK